MNPTNFLLAGLILLAGGPVSGQVVLSGPSDEAIAKCSRLSDSVKGATLKSAVLAAKKGGLPYRVTKRDGVSLALTMDYLQSRLNFEVARGKVLAASCG